MQSSFRVDLHKADPVNQLRQIAALGRPLWHLIQRVAVQEQVAGRVIGQDRCHRAIPSQFGAKGNPVFSSFVIKSALVYCLKVSLIMGSSLSL